MKEPLLVKNLRLAPKDYFRGMRIHKNQRAGLDTVDKLHDLTSKFAWGYFLPPIGAWAGANIGLLVPAGFIIAVHEAIHAFEPPATFIEGSIALGSLAGAAVGLLAGTALTLQARRGREERERFEKNSSPIQLVK